ncbi:hypothetical protein ACP8HI_12430 [Paenibacillus sp. FA6]|uniref:hypothetical protein n=1 Tax=Paenibacillus sp. FA6 TaxID=3413029 RepID=UPI003F655758
MRNFSMILVLSLIFSLLVGCSSTIQDTEVALSDESNNSISNVATSTTLSKIDVQLEVSTNVSVENTVSFTANTNLPDDMEIMLSLKNSKGYSAQDKVSITNGSFKSGMFSNKGNGLDEGIYTLEVTSPTANVQPSNVKEIIGDNGAILKGVSVKTDSVWGNTVLITKQIDVGSENASKVYTREELESDKRAPSINPNDYDSEGQYLPKNGISDDAKDYNFDGEYKPVEEMTKEEIEAELMEMLGGN